MDCIDVPLECQSLRRELRLELKEHRGDRHFPAPELNQQLTRMVVKQLLGADAEGTRGWPPHMGICSAAPGLQGCSQICTCWLRLPSFYLITTKPLHDAGARSQDELEMLPNGLRTSGPALHPELSEDGVHKRSPSAGPSVSASLADMLLSEDEGSDAAEEQPAGAAAGSMQALEGLGRPAAAMVPQQVPRAAGAHETGFQPASEPPPAGAVKSGAAAAPTANSGSQAGGPHQQQQGAGSPTANVPVPPRATADGAQPAAAAAQAPAEGPSGAPSAALFQEQDTEGRQGQPLLPPSEASTAAPQTLPLQELLSARAPRQASPRPQQVPKPPPPPGKRKGARPPAAPLVVQRFDQYFREVMAPMRQRCRQRRLATRVDPAAVPFAIKAGSLYALFCLHQTQPGKTNVYMPTEVRCNACTDELSGKGCCCTDPHPQACCIVLHRGCTSTCHLAENAGSVPCPACLSQVASVPG